MLDTNSVADATGDATLMPSIAYEQQPSAIEANLIEDVRKMGAELRELLQRIGTHVDEQHEHASATRDLAEMERLQEADPLRWHADAARSLSAGIMYAQRAVEQPAAF